MMKPQILDIFNQGADVWNKWREDNPQKRLYFNEINLRRADLSNRDFSGFNLQMLDLQGADLRHTNLSGANLYKVNLMEANLSSANLNRADLRDANLLDLDLRGINFNEAKLDGAMLQRANLSGANLSKASLIGTNLYKANLSQANLCDAALWTAILGEAKLYEANLAGAKLCRADLTDADFTGADCTRTNLAGAWLRRARFRNAKLIQTSLENSQLGEADFENTILADCSVYGLSAWGLKNLETAKQSNLIVTPKGEPKITVGDIEVAQFIYLLLNNRKIRHIIDTLTTKVVLILGRFNDKQLPVLNAIRDELRKSENNYVPVLFDFQGSDNRNLTETVSTLAHMARFVIADITEPKAVHQELQRIVPALPSVPVQLLLNSSANVGGMIEDFFDYEWVLEEYKYDNLDHLLASFQDKVIAPAEAKAEELLRKRLSRRERRSEK